MTLLDDVLIAVQVKKSPASSSGPNKGQKRKQVPVQVPGHGGEKQASIKVQKSRKKRRKADGLILQTPEQPALQGDASALPSQPSVPGASACGMDGRGQPTAPKKVKKKKKKDKRIDLLDGGAPLVRPDAVEGKERNAATQGDSPKKKRSRNKFKPDVVPAHQQDRMNREPAAKPQSTCSSRN